MYLLLCLLSILFCFNVSGVDLLFAETLELGPLHNK